MIGWMEPVQMEGAVEMVSGCGDDDAVGVVQEKADE